MEQRLMTSLFGEAHGIRVKKFKQNLPENYSKRIKIAITASKLSKFFRGSMPPTPQSFSCFSISFNLVLPKKILLKKMSKL